MKRREFLSMSAVLAAAGLFAGCAASNAGSTASSTAGSAASEQPSNGGETVKIICPYVVVLIAAFVIFLLFKNVFNISLPALGLLGGII